MCSYLVYGPEDMKENQYLYVKIEVIQGAEVWVSQVKGE